MAQYRLVLGILGVLGTGFAIAQDSEPKDPNVAAMLFACGYSPDPAPRGPFIKKGNDMEIHPEWRWVPEAKRAQVEFSRRRHSGAPFANPLCEAFLMRQIAVSGKDAHIKDRCENIRTDLYFAATASGSNAAREADADAGLSALDAFFSESKSSSGATVDGVTVESICDSAAEDTVMACAYLRFKENLSGQSAQRAAARQLRSFCSRKGVNMNELDSSALESLAQSGVLPGGIGGACGPRMGGITIRQQNSWLDTTANLTLGLTKVLAPTLTMWDIARRQQSNARYAIDANRQLGFPSIVTAGQGGFGGGGGSCGWGVGGCGGHYGGGFGGGAFIGGGAYTGLGGGCPTGACYGNGGIVVGGGNMIGGGAWGGGTCGVPPFLPGYAGCGGGIIGGGGVGGIGGIGGGPVFGGIGGNGGGWPPGLGIPGFGGGTWAPGAGAGGWGGNGFPGPWGTAGGGNGWGGPGSQQGAPSHWGAQNPYNSQMVQAQAQMYAAYAAQMARQAQQSAQAARIYQSTLDDLEKVQSRSYQAWMAYQMANSGLGGFGGSGFATGGVGAYSAGAGGVASYYPPLMSVPTQRRNSLSIGVSAGFGR